ncbi:MAG: aldehyde dehydrogenase family protein, partial [Phycisphaeraceae bacterium]
DLDDAVARLIRGAFYQTGQSCISVQRVLVHEQVYDAFSEKFVAAAGELVMGDPHEEQTFVGPLIGESAAERIDEWVGEAVERGATVLCGGGRDGVMYEPTVLEDVPKDAKVWREEVFGPVVTLAPFRDFDAALDEVNDSRFGLQAGVFTRDLYKAQRAWDRLEVGGVLINEAPSWRVDHMPYGGVKDSGLGREGPRYAIEEMTEIRLLVVRDPSAS